MSDEWDSRSIDSEPNVDDLRFIASEKESDEESDEESSSSNEDDSHIHKKILLEQNDDTPEALIEGMDKETRLLFQQKMLSNTPTGLRRSTRKRKRVRTWFEEHPDDLQIYLEQQDPAHVCRQLSDDIDTSSDSQSQSESEFVCSDVSDTSSSDTESES